MKNFSLSDKMTTPKYEQLAAQLRRRIEGGELKPQERLPTFSEMRTQLGVSQATLDRAYGLLEQDGLVERQQGRGTFVMEARAASGGNGAGQNNGWLQDSVAVLTRHEQDKLAASTPSQGALIQITRGVIEAIEAGNHHLLLLRQDRFAQRQVEQLAQSHPYGLIVTDLKEHTAQVGALIAGLNQTGVPIACYGGASELSAYDRLTSDHEAGSYAIARWLIARGHRRIVPLWSAPATRGYWFAPRIAGYERALRESDLPLSAPIVVPGHSLSPNDRTEFDARTRQVAAHLIEALTGDAPPDALMCDTDATAFYAAAALRLFRRAPNEDVALAGYDNYWQSCGEHKFEASGPLVTVDKLNTEAGIELVRLLEERAQGVLPRAPQSRVLAPQLVVTGDAPKPH